MIVQESFNPYPQSMLPDNFQYPKRYIELSKSTDSIAYDEDYAFPWWFEDYGTEGAEIAYRFRNSDVPELNLIPFANHGEWEAYFDGDDISGNPRVIVVDMVNPKYISYCKDFDEWLKTAEQDGWT